jgi:hypothetical protein
MAGLVDFIGRAMRRGRKRIEPVRETENYPRLVQLGSPRESRKKAAFKPVARNLRYFSRTPYARRAINAIRNPICQLEWEISPLPGVKMTSELKRQIELASYCFDHPNYSDSFATMTAELIEDVCCGAGAIETQIGGDPDRPLWMWPVDGLSIQMFAGWDGSAADAHYYQTMGYGGVGNLPNDGIALRDDELLYIRPNPSTADPFGFGPIEIAFLSIARQLGVADFAGNLASNARPSAGLVLKGADEDTILAFRSYWTNEIEAQGKMPIMGGEGGEAVRFWPEGDSALYLKYQEFLIREIATAFDLSPMNFGIEAGINRGQGEVAADRDWDSAIKPMASTLSAKYTRHALHKKLGFHQLQHRFLGLDREDEEATSQIMKTYYGINVFTPNDILARLGKPPSTSQWADMHSVDVEIAKAAATGMKTDLDPDLKPPAGAVAQPGVVPKNPEPTPRKPKGRGTKESSK